MASLAKTDIVDDAYTDVVAGSSLVDGSSYVIQNRGNSPALVIEASSEPDVDADNYMVLDLKERLDIQVESDGWWVKSSLGVGEIAVLDAV